MHRLLLVGVSALVSIALALLVGAHGVASRVGVIGPDSRSIPNGLIVFVSRSGCCADVTGHVFGPIYVMRADGSGQRPLTHSRSTDKVPVWSADGKRIAFTRLVQGKGLAGLGIYTMNADGSEQRKLVSGAFPAWSPDGRRIVLLRFLSEINSEIYVVNADGSGSRRLTTTRSPESAASWSSDGTMLAFDRSTPVGVAEHDLYVMNADGTHVRRLTGYPQELISTDPAWSPNGNTIAFVNGNGEISTIAADGNNYRSLRKQRDLTADVYDLVPAWSPDGSRIAFVHDNADEMVTDLYVVEADGSGLQRLASHVGADLPAWSTDGTKIAFTKDIRDHFYIYVINANGTGERPLTTRGYSDDPNWQPSN